MPCADRRSRDAGGQPGAGLSGCRWLRGSRETLERAMTALRRLVRKTGSERNPVPGRSIIFRIHLGEVEGRTATTQ